MNPAGRSAFCCGNYLHTPFADARFDGIFALETLIYTPAPERARLFREMFRILKPGRTFVSFDGFRLREPRNADELRIIQSSVEEYAEAAEQIAALPEFSWVAILEAGEVLAPQPL